LPADGARECEPSRVRSITEASIMVHDADAADAERKPAIDPITYEKILCVCRLCSCSARGDRSRRRRQTEVSRQAIRCSD